MELQRHWPQILTVLRNGKQSSRHFAIATVDPIGNPHVTPIGHAFFRDDMTGYYFDAYSRAMPRNFEHNPRICLMAVNSGTWFWLKALRRARFESAPAVRLHGEAGPQRDATSDELETLQQSIRLTRSLPGHKLLWGHLTRVRDMTFSSFSPVEYPAMCEALWP